MRASAVLGAGIDPAFARLLPFALYVAFMAVAWVIPEMAPGADVRWLYPFRVVATAAALAFYWLRYEELRMPSPTPAQVWVAIVCGAAVFMVWINLDLPWASLSEKTTGFDPRHADGRMDWLLAGLRLAGAALVVPVMEELFWRSYVMRWLDRQEFLSVAPNAVTRRALLVGSIAFGFEHNLWVAGILAGLVYGELYRRSGNLWLPVIAHGVTNGMLGLWVLWSGNWQFW